MAARFTRQEILEQLDRAASDYRFPALDHGYFYPVDVRLHAFRDDARWAMVIEVLAFSTRGLNIDDVLHIYGNCIRGEPGFEDEDFVSRVDNMDELQDEEWAVAPGVESMIVRGRALPVADREGDELVDVFRDLVPSYRDLFLADEEELRRRVPRDLPQVLTLDEWHHPDVMDGARPSESETFVLLADVLVEGRPELFRPTQAPNTHWSNWPEAGSL